MKQSGKSEWSWALKTLSLILKFTTPKHYKIFLQNLEELPHDTMQI